MAQPPSAVKPQAIPQQQLSAGIHATRADTPDALVQFQPGQLIADQFEVVRLIGRGGMGIVYEINDHVSGERMALKVILPSMLAQPRAAECFIHEVNIARRLRHDGIVAVYDFRHAGSLLLFTMEFLEGKTLRQILQERGKLSLAETATLLRSLCDALEYAHQITVHRDIAPENVMLLRDGRVKLLDFGIAKALDASSQSSAPVSMGRAHYMAPEQVRDPAHVDARADIFSLGVLFYELLSGELPTGYSRLTTLAPGLPAECDGVVAQALAPVQQRFRSVSEFRRAIEVCGRAAEGKRGQGSRTSPETLAAARLREAGADPARETSRRPLRKSPQPEMSPPVPGEVLEELPLERVPRRRFLQPLIRRVQRLRLGTAIAIGVAILLAPLGLSYGLKAIVGSVRDEATSVRAQITAAHRQYATEEVAAGDQAWTSASNAGWNAFTARTQFAKAKESYTKALQAAGGRAEAGNVKLEAQNARTHFLLAKAQAHPEVLQAVQAEAVAAENAWTVAAAHAGNDALAKTYYGQAARSYQAAIAKLAALTPGGASGLDLYNRPWVWADENTRPDKLLKNGVYRVSESVMLVEAADAASLGAAVKAGGKSQHLAAQGMFRVVDDVRAEGGKWYQVAAPDVSGAGPYWLSAQELVGKKIEVGNETEWQQPVMAQPAYTGVGEQPDASTSSRTSSSSSSSRTVVRAPTRSSTTQYYGRSSAEPPPGYQPTPVLPTPVQWMESP